MSMRIKLRGDKAIVRFGNPHEEQWFKNMMCSIRDSDPRTHPKISIKDNNGEIPRMAKPKKAPPEKIKVNTKKGKPMPPPKAEDKK